MHSPLSPRLSSSDIILSRVLVRVCVCWLVSFSIRDVKNVAISFSISSAITSYFTRRFLVFSKPSVSILSTASRISDTSRCDIVAKLIVSSMACCAPSSGVATGPPLIYRRVYLSSLLSGLPAMSLHTSFSIWGVNHIKTNVFMVLNNVWNMASPTRGLYSPILETMNMSSFTNGLKSTTAQITPNTLNTVWASAARRASVVPIDAAILAVMVVPMFSPSTMAAPISNGIHSWLSMIRVMAMVALDDCNTSVSTVPVTTNSRRLPNPYPVQFLRNCRTWVLPLRSGTELFMSDSPRNSREKPIMNFPMSLLLSFLNCCIMKPNRNRGMERAAISNLKPNNDIIQAVRVVPMLAPIITPIA